MISKYCVECVYHFGWHSAYDSSCPEYHGIDRKGWLEIKFTPYIPDPLLMELWEDMAGIPPKEEPKQLPPLQVLRETEWSSRFEQLMRNRLIMGAFRYGRLHEPNKKKWDRLERIEREIKAYQADGNDERLVDIANMALLEFEEGTHEQKHFRSADDKGHTNHVQ